jgi:hypothetical protein
MFLARSLTLEFEPVLTAFCAAGLFALVRGTRARKPLTCFVGGMLLGLGFLTKMWLIVPYAGAACAFVLVQSTLVRKREELPLLLRRSVLAAAAGFALSASAHLVFVAVVAPDDLPHWIGSVYLGIFSGRGVTGGKLSAIAGYEPKSFLYYPALLYREHFYLAPLVLFGLPSLLRRNRAHALEALAMAFAACLAVVVLSVPAVKEPLYVLAVVPLLYVLAGVSLAELENDTSKDRPANVAMVQAVIVLAGVSALGMWIARLTGGPIGAREVALHATGMAACALIGASFLRRRPVGPALLGASIVALGLFVAGASQARPNPERALVRAIARIGLARKATEGARLDFSVPHPKRLTGYLHLGLEDTTLGLPMPYGEVEPPCYPQRTYVLGPEQLSQPYAAAVLRDFAQIGREVDLGVSASGYRAFVIDHRPAGCDHEAPF